VKESFEKIEPKIIKDLIAYSVWCRKGRVEGVHPEFGKLSYLRIE